MADDDIAVTIDGDEHTPADGEGANAADPVAELKKQHDELKARTERAEADRAAALRQANAERAAREQAQRETASVRTEAIETRADNVETGIAAANSAIESAQREIQTASEAGDHAGSAKAYTKLAQATARLERLNEQKADIEIRKTEAARPAQRTEAPQPARDADPVETFLAGRSAPTAQWLRDHPEYARALATGSDPRKAAKINAAHSDALAEGIAPDSDEYFEHVEKFVGLKKAAEPEPKPNGNGAEKTVPVKPHQRRGPVAPVSGSSNGMNGGDNVVRLSKAQADAATDGTHVWNYPDPTGKNRWKVGDPIGVQEMARRVKAMKEQGLFDPNNITV